MKVLVLGSKGMVGSAIVRNLQLDNDVQIIESSRNDTNLFSLQETNELISSKSPNVVINAAAKVGGIIANNSNRTEFILSNLKINMNVIESIVNFPEIKLINLGSSCIYPLGTTVPIKESQLMTGVLEPTNSPYAMAKLTSIEMGDALSKEFGHKIINLMPTNLYGPNDNFSENESHVIPGLISRMHKSKIEHDDSFSVWGTGKPLREFLYVDDLAEAITLLTKIEIEDTVLNVGSSFEVTIQELVLKIKEIVGFEGDIIFDTSKPDGNPRKLLDSSKINNLGWKPRVDLHDGLKMTYEWYLSNNT